MSLKRYSKKEPLVFALILIPYVGGMNLILFGSCILHSVATCMFSFLISSVYLFAAYFVFGIVAVKIRKEYPAAGDLFKRIRIMLPAFYLMNIANVNGLVFLYDRWNFISCAIKPGMVWWGILFGCIMSTAITFLNEGVANFEVWKLSLSETARLKNMYQRSKLLGLKGQINPHFLFNCFNTLSGLIAIDEDKAEKFLDEMTRVHRYLLRSDDEMLVPVAEELRFAESYLYLTKERFGKAINIIKNISENSVRQFVPPLSMQVVLENIIYTNAISKNDPLTINIESNDDYLTIRHSIHEKKILENLGTDEGLDNLLNKYILLKAGTVTISEKSEERIIRMPLIKEKEVTV